MRCLYSYWAFFFLLWASSGVAQKNDYQLVRNLNEQWLYFDQSYNQYVAYTENLHQNSKMVHFWLKPEQWKSYFFLVHLQEDAYLFINHNIQNKLLKGKNFLSLDSLAKIYPQKTLFLSLYSPKAKFLEETLIVNQKSGNSAKGANPEEVGKDRNFQTFIKSRASILLLVLLLGYAFLRQYDSKTLLTYLQISKFLQIQRRLDNPFFIRLFQNSNLVFLLVYLVLNTTFFAIMEAIAPPNEAFILGKYHSAFSAYKLAWPNILVWFAWSFVWLLFKYILIVLTSNLLGLSRIVNVHFYEYVRITHWFLLPLTAGSLLLCLHFSHQPSYWYYFLKSLLLLVYVIRLLILAYNINSFTEFRKLDFFSYLCVSEMIPLLVSMKILFFT